jgi:hypothetical protein
MPNPDSEGRHALYNLFACEVFEAHGNSTFSMCGRRPILTLEASLTKARWTTRPRVAVRIDCMGCNSISSPIEVSCRVCRSTLSHSCLKLTPMHRSSKRPVPTLRMRSWRTSSLTRTDDTSLSMALSMAFKGYLNHSGFLQPLDCGVHPQLKQRDELQNKRSSREVGGCPRTCFRAGSTHTNVWLGSSNG